jgi:hypothetical protein
MKKFIIGLIISTALIAPGLSLASDGELRPVDFTKNVWNPAKETYVEMAAKFRTEIGPHNKDYYFCEAPKGTPSSAESTATS